MIRFRTPPRALPALAFILTLACAGPAAAGAGAEPAAPSPEWRGEIDEALREAADGLDALDALATLDSLERLEALAEGLHHDALLAAAELDFEGLGSRYAQRHSATEASGAPIDETRALKSNGRVYVNNVAGLVTVSVWDRNEVRVAGRLGSSAESLEIDGDSNALKVVVRLPSKARSSSDTVLELRVPKQARVDLETVSADVVANGLAGPVQVNTVSGDVTMSIAAPELAVQTVSGDVRLKGASTRSARFNSVSGDLTLEGLSGELVLETVSGDVDLSRSGRFSALTLKSVSGDMNLDVQLAAAAQVSGQTLSGEITLVVPSALSGKASLKSFSGDAQCEGAQTVEHRSGKQREFVWGDGQGATINLTSFSGDIRVERR